MWCKSMRKLRNTRSKWQAVVIQVWNAANPARRMPELRPLEDAANETPDFYFRMDAGGKLLATHGSRCSMLVNSIRRQPWRDWLWRVKK